MSTAPSPPETLTSSADRAIFSLLRWLSAHPVTPGGRDSSVLLVLSLLSPPSSSALRRRLLPLPHPLHTLSPSTPSCLVVDDRPSSPISPSAALSKLRSDAIPVSSVLGLTSLVREHRSFDSRRKFCRSYEVFFVDGRVAPLLRRAIGKQLWGKGMLVFLVELRNPDWVGQMRRACESAWLRVGDGTACTVSVGTAGMGREKLTENVVAVARRVLELWPDAKGMYIKSDESVALPIYREKSDGAEGEGRKREMQEERKVEEQRIKKKKKRV